MACPIRMGQNERPGGPFFFIHSTLGYLEAWVYVLAIWQLELYYNTIHPYNTWHIYICMLSRFVLTIQQLGYPILTHQWVNKKVMIHTAGSVGDPPAVAFVLQAMAIAIK